MQKQLILASASPRRRELVALLGLPFTVVASSVPEENSPNLTPIEYARRLSQEKAADLFSLMRLVHGFVLGADTIVVTDRPGVPTILEKPVDESDARRMLALLSGSTHTVHTAVSLAFTPADWPHPDIFTSDCDLITEVVDTQVTFRDLTTEMIDAYLATGEPFDKAGAYGIQGFASAFVEAIYGDYFNVVGLPVATVARMLESLGIEWWQGQAALE